MQNKGNRFSSGYFETACGGKKQCAFVLFCCENELNSDVPRLTTHQLNLPKAENRSTFCRKISTLRAFYRPKANFLFCSYSDVTPVYGVNPVQFYPKRSQCSHNLHQLNVLQESFELGWKSAQHSISTSFKAKQEARFICLFYPSLKSQSNFKTKRTKKTYFYSPLLLKKKKNITLRRSIWGTHNKAINHSIDK